MTSGLIYIAIIGMWVAYFAPRWIHDRNEFSGKSVERFKSALIVVANSSPQGVSGSGSIHIDLDREAKVAQLLMRRRIMFFVLAGSLTTTLVGGFMNTMPFIYSLVPLTGVLIYLQVFVVKQSPTRFNTDACNNFIAAHPAFQQRT